MGDSIHIEHSLPCERQILASKKQGESIKQGAEARVFESTFAGRRSIVKERFSKKYRHPILDSKLTLKRLNASSWRAQSATIRACGSSIHIEHSLPCERQILASKKWQVMKFDGCYVCAERIPRSGESVDDVILLAHKLYFQDQKAKFTLDHVWRILKNDQKWCSFYTTKSNPKKKKTKLNDVAAYSSSANVEEDTMERPIGIKTAKAKAKNRGKTEDNEFGCVNELQSLWVIKEKDNKFKERMSKQKLLDSLIGKSDSLLEIELSLKNSLVTELLSGYNQAEI